MGHAKRKLVHVIDHGRSGTLSRHALRLGATSNGLARLRLTGRFGRSSVRP